MTNSNRSSGELTALLRQLEERLAAAGVPMSALRPGLPREQIVAMFRARGLDAPGELIEWFGWHDGAESGIMPIPVLVPASLAWALERYTYDLNSPRSWGFDPEWLSIERVPTSLNVQLTAGAQTPLVRRSDEDHPVGDTTDTTFEVRSMCVPVSWWIEDIDSGALTWRSEEGRWLVDYAAIDRARLATGMYQ